MDLRQVPDQERGEMTIRFPYRTVAGLSLVGLLVALTAPEARADGDAGHSDVTLSGTPVSGGTHLGDALELSPGAAYTDEFVSDGELYYRIPRAMDGSTLHVSLTTDHDGGEEMDAYSIELSTWDGEDCASTTDSGTVPETRGPDISPAERPQTSTPMRRTSAARLRSSSCQWARAGRRTI